MEIAVPYPNDSGNIAFELPMPHSHDPQFLIWQRNGIFRQVIEIGVKQSGTST
jgi:hypothetical protein